MGISPAGRCGKAILMAINCTFLMAGLAFVIVGIIMHVDNKVYGEEDMVATLNKVELSPSLKLGNLASSLTVFIIVLGVFTVLLSLLGCLGACYKKRVLLFIYIIILGILLLAQIVLTILLIIQLERIDNYLRTELKGAMSIYEGVDSTDEESIGWDHLFVEFECCGVDAVTTSNDQEFIVTEWWANRGSDKVPKSCCNGATMSNYKTLPANTACTSSLTDNRQTGCYNAFKKWVEEYRVPAIVVGSLLLIAEVVGFVFAIVLAHAIKKSNIIV